jgi:cytochrome c biogenesis protein CcmG, thiol:disulfide interchange protein DsbE
VVLWLVPKAQPTTGTLVVLVAGRTEQTLPASTLMLHGGGRWLSLGEMSGFVPAAPVERQIATWSPAAGPYDAVRLGADSAAVSVTIAHNQVEPLLLGIDSGHLIPGATYAGNDEANLGLGELSGKFVPMPDFHLEDQHGRPFSSQTASGHDLVIAAFHTTCHETCPLYTALFSQLAKHLAPSVILAEVTTDPAVDTPAALAAYAGAVGAGWTFATGSADALIEFWEPFGVQLASGDVHVSTLALIDSHGFVRLVYRGVPDVGHAIDPNLVTSLSAAGLQELASGGDGWGAPDVIQALATIGSQAPTPARPGGVAPHFTLTASSGQTIDSDQLRGQALVINFWASYCPPCRAEMPMLERDVTRSRARLVLIDEGEGGQAARSFLAALGVNQPALLDTDLSVGRAYSAVAFPTTVFVDAGGNIVGRDVGQLDEDVLQTQLTLMGG